MDTGQVPSAEVIRDAVDEAAAGFGMRLREAREGRKLTQYELGRLIGFRENDISRWELGTNAPALPAVIALAVALGVTTDWLVGMDALDLGRAGR